MFRVEGWGCAVNSYGSHDKGSTIYKSSTHTHTDGSTTKIIPGALL